MMPASNAQTSMMANPNPIVSTAANAARPRQRAVLVVSSDASLRERLSQALIGLRWQVIEAPAGAQAWCAVESTPQLETILIDPWLPDLDVSELLHDLHRDHPQLSLMLTDGGLVPDSPRSSHHQELLYALRRSQEGNTAAWNGAPSLDELLSRSDPTELSSVPTPAHAVMPPSFIDSKVQALPLVERANLAARSDVARKREGDEATYARQPSTIVALASASTGMTTVSPRRETAPIERIPELVGSSLMMLEVSRRIRLVAERSTPVLIEGPTGSGKELVAEALHRLSNRARKPFVAINCAAIPEALLEAELFGHTRGAFTGAVQGRTGRIEAADGGTLFLDEIGEMPLALQAKLLRFFESGELQRIGDNETVKVDVRIVAATHQQLADDAQKGVFRADLYYRLAVFLIRTPALAEHMEDLPQLVNHFMGKMGRRAPVKRLESSALARLAEHSWPGNVRELEHVLERASILAGDEPTITASEIDFGHPLMN